MSNEVLDRRWFALRVRLRHEKYAAVALGNKGYEIFLPTYKCRKRLPGRYRNVELPLFPGYLFCRFDALRRLPILITPGVVQIVGLGKTPVPLEDDEIRAIQTIVLSRLAVQPWSYLKTGQIVTIEAGPLRGLTGSLLAFQPQARLVVSIELLQRSVAVQIDRDWVPPFPPDSRDTAASRASTLRLDSLCPALVG
jgi:transcription termination/antitermination protein NusG